MVRRTRTRVHPQEQNLKNENNTGFSDRRTAAARAKASLLEAYQAAKTAAEPTREARDAERAAVAKAREERQAKRDQEKREEQARIQAEADARAAAAAAAETAEADAREAADKDRIARILNDDAAHKAKRDQRYANRKNRQG